MFHLEIITVLFALIGIILQIRGTKKKLRVSPDDTPIHFEPPEECDAKNVLSQH